MFESVRVAMSSTRAPATSVIVVGVFAPASKSARPALDPDTRALDKGGAVDAALARPEFSADLGRIAEAHGAPQRTLIVGLGRKDALDADALRHAAACAARRLADVKATHASLELAHAIAHAGRNAPDAHRAGQACGEGVGLAAFNFDGFKGSASAKADRVALTLHTAGKRFHDGLARGVALATSANLSRWWSSTPPNVATPAWMAQQARLVGQKTGMNVTVYEGRALDQHNLTGLKIVGDASINKPCLIRLEYKPRRAKRGARPVALVGKTLTYDTGGLSLKINNGMRGMKGDKDGGCAVLGAMHAIATVIKPDRPVVALLAAAENSVADNAYRPDDVLTFRNGVTVEVTNTDAEGRLVLADALCWACDEENASHVIDVATLTGGVVVALGSTYAGMWCDDDALRAKIERAAHASGERVWRLPHHNEYREMMKSTVADVVNSNPNRKAHPIQGAAFLSYFVKESVAWCHLDIAGVHVDESGRAPFTKDVPTGFGVRLLAETIAQL